jgi:hypothetical protein
MIFYTASTARGRLYVPDWALMCARLRPYESTGLDIPPLHGAIFPCTQ